MICTPMCEFRCVCMSAHVCKHAWVCVSSPFPIIQSLCCLCLSACESPHLWCNVADLQKKLTRLSAGKNPNLNQLSEVIIEKLDGQWEASRVMVFVRTRATCQALCDWLNSDHVNRELQQLKAAPFTGSAAHQDQGGTCDRSILLITALNMQFEKDQQMLFLAITAEI